MSRPRFTAALAGACQSSQRWRSGIAAIGSVYQEHQVILLYSWTFVVLGGLFQWWLGRPWPVRLISGWFFWAWVFGSALYFALLLVRDPKSCGAALSVERSGAALLVAMTVVPVQVTFQAIKQSVGPTVGFPWDGTFSRWDDAIHGGPAWHHLSWLFNYPGAVYAIDRLYLWWLPLLALFLTGVSWSRSRLWRHRTIMAMLFLWIAGGTIAPWGVSSSGPCYLPDYAPLHERLKNVDRQLPLQSLYNQRRLLMAHNAPGTYAEFAGISAMPSLHVAASVLLAIAVTHRSWFWGAAAWSFAAIIQVGSVLTGWHWAIDGYVGAFLAWGAWWVAGRAKFI